MNLDRTSHQLGSHRIEMDVNDELAEVAGILD
jgi:hypothetical protein